MATEHVVVNSDSNGKIRLLIAEDNEHLSAALEALFEAKDEFLCVASTGSLREIVPLCMKHLVKVVILDIDLRGESSIKALPMMRRALPGVRFIVFSGHAQQEMIRADAPAVSAPRM